jgi:hypothetical protein
MDGLGRRKLLGMAAMLPLAALAGCETVGGFSLDEGVRRLLTLSSQRAFDRLLQPGGFYDDQLTRIAPPESLDRSGADILGAVLRTDAVRRQMAIALNDVAYEAADRATPIVMDAIRGMSFADAVSVIRGGPTAATDLLQRAVGGALVDAMFPEINQGLGSDLAQILSAAIAARTGVDYVELARNVAGQASGSIFRAIAREESAIRADPRSTRDPAIIALFGGLGR